MPIAVIVFIDDTDLCDISHIQIVAIAIVYVLLIEMKILLARKCSVK